MQPLARSLRHVVVAGLDGQPAGEEQGQQASAGGLQSQGEARLAQAEASEAGGSPQVECDVVWLGSRGTLVRQDLPWQCMNEETVVAGRAAYCPCTCSIPCASTHTPREH